VSATLRRLLIWFAMPALLAAASMVLTVALPVDPAAAQVEVKRRSLFDMLFGPRRIRPPPAEPAPERTNRRPAPSKPKRSAAKQRTPIIEKRDDASTVLVLGDFMAAGLSDGLDAAFAQSPGVAIVKRTNGSSGLVRNDYYDWPESLPAILDEVRPAIAVVMIGSNDRQQMRVDSGQMRVGSDGWVNAYETRVRAVANAVRSRDIPLLWVGAPPFRSPSMSADILAFNGIFRSVAADADGEFIDIWDGFVDENGKFVFSGSDIKGQTVRLRASDGIGMTQAGRRKLAFYVEKPVRRIIGDSADRRIPLLGEDSLPELIVLHPDPGERLTRTVPIDMSDPALDGTTVLLGDDVPPLSLIRTPRDDLVFDGRTTEAPPGRADHFVWPRHSTGTARP